MNRIVSTGKIIKMYLSENDLDASMLADASNVSLRTIIRILNDERPIGMDVAIGMNKLIPEISPDFLVSYDSKYQLQKRIIEKENGDINVSEVISHYHMKKLYKDLADDELALFEKAKAIFGIENIENRYKVNVDELSFCFSLANGEKDNNHLIWLKTAYEECVSERELLKFDEESFLSSFQTIKEKTFALDIKSALYNMNSFCKKSGINFYYRKSIPSARVKAVAVRDKKGFIYIFVSDLFKCVENLWLAFIHECIHIKNRDFDKVQRIKDNLGADLIDENYVDEESIGFFIGDATSIDYSSIDSLISLSNQTNSPLNIVVEIARYKTNNYSNQVFNKYIHYYK